MGHVASKTKHEEYNRSSINLEGSLQKWDRKKGNFKERWFSISNNKIWYSLAKGSPVMLT